MPPLALGRGLSTRGRSYDFAGTLGCVLGRPRPGPRARGLPRSRPQTVACSRMPHALTLLRPALLALVNRFRRDGRAGRRSSGPTALLAVALYVLLFIFLSDTFAGALSNIDRIARLETFAATRHGDVASELTALGLSVGLLLLFVLSTASSAARSLDQGREGRDLLLLAAQPVSPGALVIGRAMTGSLLDPTGFLLLAPLLSGCLRARLGCGLIPSLALALPVCFVLRTLVQAAALLLIAANRAWLPRPLRPEAGATVFAGAAVALLLARTGLDPSAIALDFRSAASLLAPIGRLLERTAFLVPSPIAATVEGLAAREPLGSLAGLAGLVALLLVLHGLANLTPVHVLVSRPHGERGGRALGRIWDWLLPHCTHPAAAFALKDIVTAWRANLMLAPTLPVAIPLALAGLFALREPLAGLPPPMLLVPVLLLAATALPVSLFEAAEGRTPPPLPVPPSRILAWKAFFCGSLSVAAGLLVLLAAYPLARAAPSLPTAVLCGILWPLLLIELLAREPGAGAEVFSPGGVRVALVWSTVTIGSVGVLAEGSSLSKLPPLVALVSALWALRGRERAFDFDFSIRDAALAAALFCFATHSLGLVVAFAASVASLPGVVTSLLGTAALQTGLAFWSIAYARQAGGVAHALGLPPASPVSRALLAGGAGCALAALFGWLQASGGGWETPAPGSFGLSPASLLRMTLASALGPVAEELFFRGIVQRAAAGAIGRWPGLIVSSLLFAGVHSGPFSLTLVALGIVLGGFYEWRRSVFDPIVAHVMFNHVQVVGSDLVTELSKVLGS